MSRYAGGDDAAFAELYDHLAERLYRRLFRWTKDQALAEDLLQQTFLKIHRQRGHFIPGAPVTPWAFRIAENLTKDAWRKRQRRAGHAWRLRAPEHAAAGEEELVIAKQTASQIEARLLELPATQRRAFELRRFDGLSLRETAQVCGTTVAAVKQLLHRAQVALREGVDEMEGLA